MKIFGGLTTRFHRPGRRNVLMPTEAALSTLKHCPSELGLTIADA